VEINENNERVEINEINKSEWKIMRLMRVSDDNESE
jgi:hypothetical protein